MHRPLSQDNPRTTEAYPRVTHSEPPWEAEEIVPCDCPWKGGQDNYGTREGRRFTFHSIPFIPFEFYTLCIYYLFDLISLISNNSFDLFTRDLFLPLRSGIVFCTGICDFLPQNLSWTSVETFKIVSLSLLRRSPHSVTSMEFSVDDVTGAGHHGSWVGCGWWKGKVLTEVARRTTNAVPQHGWFPGGSLWKPRVVAVGPSFHVERKRIPPWEKNDRHPFPEQMFLVRKIPW